MFMRLSDTLKVTAPFKRSTMKAMGVIVLSSSSKSWMVNIEKLNLPLGLCDSLMIQCVVTGL